MKQRAGSVLRFASPLRAWLQRFALLALVSAAFALMLLGKTEAVLVERARTAVVDAVTPLLDAASRPVATVNEIADQVQAYISLRDENAVLRARVDRLLHWQAAALRLEAENTELRELLNVAADPRLHFVSARVIGDQGGAFVRSVLVNAGIHEGVQRGQGAIAGAGLAGRVAQVGERSSRVLLLNDMNSRVPVLVGKGRHRAVMAGDNTDYPGLLYLGPRVQVMAGDRVVTSGHGGVLPPGLPVGVVTEVGERGARVELFADTEHLEFLRLVDYEMPGLVLPAGAQP